MTSSSLKSSSTNGWTKLFLIVNLLFGNCRRHTITTALLFWNCFGQSEFQVKKSLKCFHFSFAYARYYRVNAGSNYVYPIFADSESPPPLQKLVYAFVAVDLWPSQINVGVNNLHSYITEIHVETFVTGYNFDGTINL